MAERIDWKPRGVVGGAALARQSPAGRFAPDPRLAPFVEHLWTVAWDLGGGPPVTRETLPHPAVHLVIEAGRSGLAGPTTGRFTRILEGRGRVLGVKFLPGGFRPFWGRPVSGLADRVLPLQEAFGDAGAALEAAVLACGDDEDGAVAAAEAFLLARLPEPDPEGLRARAIVARIQADRSLTRAEQVAEAEGLSLRTLQRLFGEQVGVPPKWVLRRCRLHEAMARLESGEGLDLAGLALDLGYADQAHFTRDFKAVLGRAPGTYARQEA
ncbi:MAG TPA: helix-turn-helix domain-containing protein [Holophagaceae bacterium]|nr:helix-turn-helix domain-containing protein [Holophagaceae bacterium]